MRAVAAHLLGHVAGGVGLGQQVARRHARVIDEHAADAGADHVAGLLPDEHVTVDAATDALGAAFGFVAAGQVGQQHAEFIAAEPGQHVARTQLPAHHDRQLGQQLVAGRVAGGVVDQLELVQVHVQQGGERRRGRTGRQQRLQLALELAAVVQVGQHVVAGLVAQQLVELALLADVAGHQQQLAVAAQFHPRDRHAGPEAFAAGILQLRFHATAAAGVVRAQLPVQVVVIEQLGQALIGDAVAQAIARGLVGVGDAPAVGIGQYHQRRQQLVQRAEALLALAEAPAHPPAQFQRALPRADDGVHQHGQQHAGQHAHRQGRLAPVEPGRARRTRAHHHLQHAPAVGQLLFEAKTVAGFRHRGRRVVHRHRVRRVGDIAQGQAQLPRHVRRHHVAEQLADAERDRDRTARALAPLRQGARRLTRAEHRQAHGEPVRRTGTALLHRAERRGQGHFAAVARGQQPGQIVRLRRHVEVDHCLVALARLHPAGDEMLAPRAALTVRVGQRQQAGELRARTHVVVETGELGLGDLVRGEEQRLHRTQQGFGRLQPAQQGRIGLARHLAAHQRLLGAMPLLLLQVGGKRQRQARQQGQHAPPQRTAAPTRRRHGDGLGRTVRPAIRSRWMALVQIHKLGQFRCHGVRCSMVLERDARAR